MGDDDDTKLFGIVQRIDERTLALREGSDRIREDVEEVRRDQADIKNKVTALTNDDNGGLKRIIDERVRARFETRSMSARDWISVVIGAIALFVAGLAYLKG